MDQYFGWIRPLAEFAEKQKRNYPDALGYQLSAWVAKDVLKPFIVESPPFDLTPAQVICKQILFKGGVHLMIEFGHRYEAEVGTFTIRYEGIQEELQGYVDTLALYVSACIAKANGTLVDLTNAGVSQLPGWTALSDTVRLQASKFVLNHGNWAVHELIDDDFVDGRAIMNKIVSRVTGTGQVTPSYARGVRTARDTLGLYMSFIIAFFRGELYFGPA
jgi:hypothetical protein